MRHPFLRTLAGQGRDPNFKNTVLLLHGDGTNGAQNNTFVDGSSNNFTITRNGNTTQGSFSPYGDNWSNYFDGSGDYLSLASNAAFGFGTGDFTIECWLNVTNTTGIKVFYETRPTTGGSQYPILYVDGTSIIWGSGPGLTATSAITTSTWTHVAVTRSGTTLRLFVNGSIAASNSSDSTNYANPATGRPFIGADTGLAGNWYNGYISNFRILKGTAQYTSAFTPATTPLTAITNTSLLTCQSNRFQDNSTNAFAITRNGDVSVQRFSPFAPSAAYSTSAIGGSGYFDGTGDYLSVADNAALELGSSNFTVEAWIYLTGGSGTQRAIITKRSAAANFGGYSLYLETSNALGFVADDNTSTPWAVSILGTTVTLGQWTHVAITRSGSTWTLWKNGVSDGTATSSITINDAATNLSIGAVAAGETLIVGYISDARVVNGTALYTAAFTPPTAPLTAVTNTSLLCNFTNAGIYDNAMMNDLETVGNAQISTTQKKYGTGALYFDGSGDYLKLPQSPSFQWGTGDFTIEFWVYFSTLAGSLDIFEQRTAEPQTAIILYSTSSTIRLYVNGADRITSGTISAATWMHVALCRSGTSTKLFINGTQAGSTYTDSNNYSTQACFIGANFLAAANFFNGYIDDLRITKGVARYTANFTPPAAPLADF